MFIVTQVKTRFHRPANEQERVQVAELCQAVQEVTGQSVKVAFVDQVAKCPPGHLRGYTGDDAKEEGIRLKVVKHKEAKKCFVVLPKRWVCEMAPPFARVERSIAWTARFRRLARDYERLPETLAGLHFVVFAGLMLVKASTKGLLLPCLQAQSS